MRRKSEELTQPADGASLSANAQLHTLKRHTCLRVLSGTTPTKDKLRQATAGAGLSVNAHDQIAAQKRGADASRGRRKPVCECPVTYTVAPQLSTDAKWHNTSKRKLRQATDGASLSVSAQDQIAAQKRGADATRGRRKPVCERPATYTAEINAEDQSVDGACLFADASFH